MKTAFVIWGALGFIASLVSGITLIFSRPNLYDLNWIAAGVLIWIGGLIYFGIAALLEDAEKTRAAINR